jgi:hypothetical protein
MDTKHYAVLVISITPRINAVFWLSLATLYLQYISVIRRVYINSSALQFRTSTCINGFVNKTRYECRLHISYKFFLDNFASSLSVFNCQVKLPRFTTFTASAMLKDWLLPQLQHHQNGTLMLQQDGAPPPFQTQLRAYLDSMFSAKWIGRVGPILWSQIWHR